MEIGLHANHNAPQVLGHLMIAFLFIYRCFTAMPRFEEHAGRLAARGMPFPGLSLIGGFGLMLGGGFSLALDIYPTIGGCMLIVFTMAANWLHHNFWSMEGGERNRHLYTFCNNVAVMGGIVLVIAG